MNVDYLIGNEISLRWNIKVVGKVNKILERLLYNIYIYMIVLVYTWYIYISQNNSNSNVLQ